MLVNELVTSGLRRAIIRLLLAPWWLTNWYRVAQKLWPKRSGLLWPHHLHNESKFSWNAFLSSAIRGFYQNNTKICSFFVHFCSFQSFSATSDQLLLLIHITSCLASRILLTLKKWELYLLRWLRYQAESIWSWRGIRWSDDLIRRGTGSLDMHLAPWEPH